MTMRINQSLNLTGWKSHLDPRLIAVYLRHSCSLLLKVVLSLVQRENVWRSNTVKHCLVTGQVDVELRGQTVSKMFERAKCVVTKQCLIVFDSQTFPVWTGLYGKTYLPRTYHSP